MLYLVHFEVSVEAGRKIETLPNGPGPLMGHIVERFQPKHAYFCPTKRQGWLFVDLKDSAKMAELMMTLTDNLGTYPTFTPVIEYSEFGKVVGEAIAAANKAPKVW
jgi:hypothetical protein